MKLNNRGNWTLVGLLVTFAIIFVAAALFFGKSGDFTTVKSKSPLLDSKSKKQTVLGRSMDTAKASDCAERLRQIRLGIQTYKTSGASEANPPDFKSIGLGVSMDYFQCPVSHQPYTYDPATGTVKCPTHTNF